MANIGKIEPVEITTEVQKSYLDYAMSVIVARALPDVRDGLKPVHRRILFAMHEMGLGPTSKFLKSARIVGETMGKYHPHGNMAIYDALVRLAQDFSMRYPLIWGQGNFGSVDGDPPAADRYTEAKLQTLAMEMLQDLDKETVDLGPNYDGSFDEPLYLPAKLPNLLLMGSEGIAVGMATKIPPHNITEVIDGALMMLKRTKVVKVTAEEAATEQSTEATTPKEKVETVQVKGIDEAELLRPIKVDTDVTLEELMEHIKGPDFPTGASIYDISEIKAAYSTGKGRIVMRGKADIEEIGNGKSAIIITELPYQVNKALLVAKIAELARDKKIEGITDLRDESDRRGLRVVVELKRDAIPKKILNNLYKQTALQSVFPVNVVALVDGTPQTLTLKAILEEFVKHRYNVVTRRSLFELHQAQARLHILEGLMIAVNNIDAVIKTIRESKDSDAARTSLMEKFKLSEIQATAILDMQLRRLAALERQKIEEEYKQIKATIDSLIDLLIHPEKILKVVSDELEKLKEKFGDARKTKVYKGKVGEFSDEDLIPNEATVITLTTTGYIKRQSLNSFRVQHRGGKGIKGMTTKEEDSIQHIRTAETHDNLLFFTNKGKAYQLRAYEIAESQRTSKGTAIVNLLNIEQGEKIESFIIADKENKSGFIFLTTKKGVVKKTRISEFDNIRKNGILAIHLDKGDELVWSNMTSGTDTVLLVTRNGKAIHFNESEARPLGRNTIGVRGIKLTSDDEVIGMDVIKKGDNPEVLSIMENGLGKKTQVNQFPKQARGGQGVKVANVTPKTGKVASAQVVPANAKQVIITSKKGLVVKLALSSIPRLSRATQGVILMRFSNAGDCVTAATCVEDDPIEAPAQPAPEEV